MRTHTIHKISTTKKGLKRPKSVRILLLTHVALATNFNTMQHSFWQKRRFRNAHFPKKGAYATLLLQCLPRKLIDAADPGLFGRDNLA